MFPPKYGRFRLVHPELLYVHVKNIYIYLHTHTHSGSFKINMHPFHNCDTMGTRECYCYQDGTL